jgi:UDP-N-acetylglucosamine--N-acetylmuramyl-(pentapeptide) pyrophosphoryl-undecaprenol N-acetylglucosamine transferase
MKLIITGGHVTPALALIEHIETTQTDWKVVFVGRKYAAVGDKTTSEEFRIIQGKHIPFIGLTAGRVRRFMSVGTIVSFCMIPVGFIQALGIVMKEKPDRIVSFGGYIGLPMIVAGWFFGIPTVIHEQAAVPGLSNRIASFFAGRVCASNERSAQGFPKGKTVVTGMPLRNGIYDPPAKFSSPIPDGRKIVYITGGVTGSRSVNELFYPIIGKLVGKFTVIHQVGRAWVSEGRNVRQGIRGDKRKYYVVQAYFDQHDHSWLMHHASLLVGRSGANTVAEIDVIGIPALLIPLPWSAGNEQYENAQVLVRKGKAMCLDQKTLNPVILLGEILSAISSSGDPKRTGSMTGKRHIDAAEKLFSVIAGFRS